MLESRADEECDNLPPSHCSLFCFSFIFWHRLEELDSSRAAFEGTYKEKDRMRGELLSSKCLEPV